MNVTSFHKDAVVRESLKHDPIIRPADGKARTLKRCCDSTVAMLLFTRDNNATTKTQIFKLLASRTKAQINGDATVDVIDAILGGSIR